MKCEICGFESDKLDEVSYYSINGDNYSDEFDIENNLQNPDALAHALCKECTENFKFNWYQKSYSLSYFKSGIFVYLKQIKIIFHLRAYLGFIRIYI